MNRLLKLFDTYFLKFGIAFLLVFTALYPKLPSVHIVRTWVYIRLEDFVILAVVLVWFIQLIRKKVNIPFKLSLPVFAYWSAGLISLVFSLLFIGPHLLNFFPHVAMLNYLRRIEYMILFFVAFTTIRSVKDIRDYLVVLSLTVFGIVIYGLGQNYYLKLWALFPAFFEKYSFCFPSFQTGNEEFAKGIPLCLPQGARITSTFGGHYDLAAYLVMVLPVLLLIPFAIKKIWLKLLSSVLFILALILLILTASRISFVSYLIGICAALIIYKRKLFIIPVLLLSVFVLLLLSGSTAKRLLSTIRISSIVTNNQGQLVGEASLPSDLKNKISKDTIEPQPAQDLQSGSTYIGLPQEAPKVTTNSATLTKTLSPEESRRLKLANGSLQISTVSGSFLIQKALVLDISFTTRFQAEWPNAWNAFLRNPVLGSGYSAITLATDNDYFRALGETGLLGIVTFLFIFLVFGLALADIVPQINSTQAKVMVIGIAAGVIGLLFNAGLIDVFEASKVAENLWILLGIGLGTLLLFQKKPIPLFADLKKILTSNILLAVYLFFISLAVYLAGLKNFFVADDFTWLHWAAISKASDIINYFTNSQNFFYRPLDKTIVYFLYTLFSFQPEGYHLFTLLLHFGVAFGVFILISQILRNKLAAFFGAVLFLLSPAIGENIYWFSTISVTLAALLILYSVICFYRFRTKKSVVAYVVAFILSVLAFFTYEQAVVIPLLFIALDILILRQKRSLKAMLAYVPFLLLIPVYFIIRMLTHAFTSGGDYSYSLVHFIPNIIGNIFGYLGLFLSGEIFLPLYTGLRGSMKTNSLIFTVFMLALLGILLWLIVKFKDRLTPLFRQEHTRVILFGLTFGLIALLPYLALGNIAQRYIYLASAGFSLSAITLLWILTNWLTKGQKNAAALLFISLAGIMLILFQLPIPAVRNEWDQAGQITKNMLTEFRIDYESFTPSTGLYFVNVPQKYQNAWVFPVGLPDSLWFIYRQSTPRIFQVTNVNDAKSSIGNSNSENYIFEFDKNGNIKRIE